jgi:branched-chain amino acid transport system substrate-binding protein
MLYFAAPNVPNLGTGGISRFPRLIKSIQEDLMKKVLYVVILSFVLLFAASVSLSATGAEDSEAGDGPIVFGGALPLTGWGSDAGEYNNRGYNLWLKHINEDGGILGRPVELKIYDDQSDPTITARLYERLINEDKVDVLIAPWSDDMTMPATTVAERYGKPIVTGGATLDAIWGRGYKYVNGLLPSSYDYVGVAMRLLEGMVDTVAIPYADMTYTTGFGDAAVTNAEELGMEIVAHEAYSADSTDFTAMLTKIRGAKPDFLAVGAGGEDAIQLIRQSKEVGLSPSAFYFTIAPVDPEFVRVLGSDAEYILGTTEWEPTMTHLPGFQRFYDDYVDEYGEEPIEDVATAYGLCQVLQAAVEGVGEINDDLIAEALRQLETVTVFGTYNVDPETGAQKGKELFVIQIQDGKRVVIWPEADADGDLRFPAPAWNDR